MRKALWSAVILMAFMLTACNDDNLGELRIRNRTAANVYVSLNNETPRTLAAWMPMFRFYPENEWVAISYSGDYVFSYSTSRQMHHNYVSLLDIEPDGGAVRIVNDGTVPLSEVYISPNGDPNWGDDDLAGNLAPGDSTLWTTTEGNWDIRVVGNNLVTYYQYNQSVVKNETLSLKLSDFDSKSRAKTAGLAAYELRSARTEQQRIQ